MVAEDVHQLDAVLCLGAGNGAAVETSGHDGSSTVENRIDHRLFQRKAVVVRFGSLALRNGAKSMR